MGTSTTVNAATIAGAWRSNKAARTGTYSRHHESDTESHRASGNAAGESDDAARNQRSASTHSVTSANSSGW